MTRHPILALAAAALLSGCSTPSGLATKYRSSYLLGGYSDKIVEPGVWKVTGRSNGVAEPGFGRNMAAYRAAEVVKAAGFSHMQIIAQKGKAQTINGSSAGEFLTLTVRGVNDPAPPTDCREKQPTQCFTLEVDEVMARLRPVLRIDPARP
ncbi:MAG TPA: hypothetical protein VF650_03310 [Allosphingosinicella sp.]|jgi:hypothetical protein